MSAYLIIAILFSAIYLVSAYVVDRRRHQQDGSRTYFGITVDPLFYTTQAGRRIYLRWRQCIWTVTVAACIVMLLCAFARESIQMLAPIAIFYLYLFAVLIIFRFASASTRPYAIPAELGRTASLTAQPSMPVRWKILYLSIHVLTVTAVAGSAWFMHHHADLLLYQMAFRARGAYLPGAESAAHRLLWHGMWSDFFANYSLLLSAAFGTLIMLTFAFGLQFRSRPADWTDGTPQADDYRRRTMLLLALYEVMFILQFAGQALQPVVNRGPEIWGVCLMIFYLAILAICIIAGGMFYGQRTKRPKGLVDHIDDARWKWGQFYVDRNDPAWFVPARSGASAAMNYGQPFIQLVMAISILFVAIFTPLFFLQTSAMKSITVKDRHHRPVPPANPESALYQLALQNMHYGDRRDAAAVLTAYAQVHPEVSVEVAQALATGR